ncbi:hypothetical protein [Lyngbya sp. CCY1209]|uniref:hypothetical protein n=1 Tax=Lyngbya sp. CCY1209 TaxID=2886103 RepID=UPI002D1FF726|nr:hypothetical protein [Lyngbya sp. CCY1209]MEB3883329.1 hypothetical protein [Lyngbya sp. CCY1209]
MLTVSEGTPGVRHLGLFCQRVESLLDRGQEKEAIKTSHHRAADSRRPDIWRSLSFDIRRCVTTAKPTSDAQPTSHFYCFPG